MNYPKGSLFRKCPLGMVELHGLSYKQSLTFGATVRTLSYAAAVGHEI